MNQKTYQELKDGEYKSDYLKIKQGGTSDNGIYWEF